MARINRYPQADFINPSTVGINISTLAPNFLYFSVSGYFNSGCGSCAPAVYNDGQTQLADDVDLDARTASHLHGSELDLQSAELRQCLPWKRKFHVQRTIERDALLDFLLGTPNSFQQGNPSLANPRQQYIGLYAQDDFKVSPRLQVHVGLRWEPFLPAGDKFNRTDHFSAAAFAAGRSAAYTRTRRPDCSLSAIQAYRRASSIAGGRISLPASASHGTRTGRATRLCVRLTVSFTTGPNSTDSTHPGQGAPWGSTITLSNPAGGLATRCRVIREAIVPGKVPPAGNQVFPTADLLRHSAKSEANVCAAMEPELPTAARRELAVFGFVPWK